MFGFRRDSKYVQGRYTYFASRLLSQNLFASNPSVVINKFYPAFQDFEAKVVIPSSNVLQVESLIPSMQQKRSGEIIITFVAIAHQ